MPVNRVCLSPLSCPLSEARRFSTPSGAKSPLSNREPLVSEPFLPESRVCRLRRRFIKAGKTAGAKHRANQIKRRKRPRLATARALELLAEIAGHVYTASPEVSGQTPYRSADGAVPRGSSALTAQFGLLSAGGTVGVSESVNRLKMERVRAFAPPRYCPRRSGWERRFRRPDDRAGLKNLRREHAEAAARTYCLCPRRRARRKSPGQLGGALVRAKTQRGSRPSGRKKKPQFVRKAALCRKWRAAGGQKTCPYPATAFVLRFPPAPYSNSASRLISRVAQPVSMFKSCVVISTAPSNSASAWIRLSTE